MEVELGCRERDTDEEGSDAEERDVEAQRN